MLQCAPAPPGSYVKKLMTDYNASSVQSVPARRRALLTLVTNLRRKLSASNPATLASVAPLVRIRWTGLRFGIRAVPSDRPPDDHLHSVSTVRRLEAP